MVQAEEEPAAQPSIHQASAKGEGSKDEPPTSQWPSTGTLPQDEDYKIRLSASQEEKLKHFYEAASTNSVISQIHGQNPGIKGLQTWCRDNLHQSLVEVSKLEEVFLK